MVFSSIIFLFYFIPAFFLVYYIVPNRFRNFICLLGSLFFYAWGEPYYVFLMLLSIALNYFLGRSLRFDRADKARKHVMLLACVVNLSMLFVFKCLTFFMQTAYDLFGIQKQAVSLPLPLGISFYTFQLITYCVDVYRDEVPPQRSFAPFDTASSTCERTNAQWRSSISGPMKTSGSVGSPTLSESA